MYITWIPCQQNKSNTVRLPTNIAISAFSTNIIWSVSEEIAVTRNDSNVIVVKCTTPFHFQHTFDIIIK